MVNSRATPPTDETATTAHTRAYTQLREMLLQMEFPPGTRLTEAQLTDQLHVSRGTLRAVLAQLSQEGFLVRRENMGVVTRSFTIKEAAEILETRAVLESALAELAAAHATDDEITAMRETLELMKIEKASGNAAKYSELNIRFHSIIRSSARQSTLKEFLDSLHYPLVMRQYRDLGRPHPRAGSLEEHQAIYSAIVTRNVAAAGAAMRHHVNSAREALLLKYPSSSRNGD